MCKILHYYFACQFTTKLCSNICVKHNLQNVCLRRKYTVGKYISKRYGKMPVNSP